MIFGYSHCCWRWFYNKAHHKKCLYNKYLDWKGSLAYFFSSKRPKLIYMKIDVLSAFRSINFACTCHLILLQIKMFSAFSFFKHMHTANFFASSLQNKQTSGVLFLKFSFNTSIHTLAICWFSIVIPGKYIHLKFWIEMQVPWIKEVDCFLKNPSKCPPSHYPHSLWRNPCEFQNISVLKRFCSSNIHIGSM